jgi:hypothetical protein
MATQLDTRSPRLTQDNIAAYRRDGLIIPDYRLPPSQLAHLRAALDEVIAGNPDVRPEQLISIHVKRGSERTRGHDAFLEFAHDKAILDLVEQLIGPDIILWGCQSFCKPAGDGMEVPWHQDGRYWPIRPLATCTVWVALDDSNTENGCMRYIPGTHLGGHVYKHRKDDRPDLALDLVLEQGEADIGAARDVVLEAGRFSMHDVFLVHGSNPNRSTKRRAGLAMRFMPATSHFDREMFQPSRTTNGLVVDFTKRPLWLVRGQDRTGRNDLKIGHA